MQALLTNSIEVIFAIFIVSAIADFVSGLIRINTPIRQECTPRVHSLPMEGTAQQAVKLPDPWMCDTLAVTPSGSTAISPLPRLLLLPPAKPQESAELPAPDALLVAALAPTLPMPDLNPPITQKRKPGRPKKDSPAPTLAPKRKPGRPRKTA